LKQPSFKGRLQASIPREQAWEAANLQIQGIRQSGLPPLGLTSHQGVDVRLEDDRVAGRRFTSSNRSDLFQQFLSALGLAAKLVRAMKGAPMRSGCVGGCAALGAGARFEQNHQCEKACRRCLAAMKPMIQRLRLYPEYARKIFQAQIMRLHKAA
jgi:hypothetical protein